MHTSQQITLRRLKAHLLIALFLLLALVPFYQVDAAPQTKQEPCTTDAEFRDVPGLGKACRHANGLWKVKLSNGNFLYTHGTDAHQPSSVNSGSTPTAVNATGPLTCAPAGSYRMFVIYAYAPGVANQFSARLGTIRSYVQEMNNALTTESQTFGVTTSLRVACDGDGQVTVRSVALSTTAHDIAAIDSDLRSKGYNSGFDKYLVFYEQGGCGGGVAWLFNDDSNNVNNANNKGPGYAISWGFCGYGVGLHEYGHAMGAVQNSAPNTSGAGHCIDDQDVMCYNDGGPRAGQLHVACSDREHFDCNNNDYFHPNPPGGNYLATHWNVASCLNRFINRSGCGTPPPPPPPPAGEAHFALINRASGKCMDVASSNMTDGAKIQIWTCNGTNAQQWRLEAAGNGSYRLVARHSGKCADVAGGNSTDGTLIIQWACGTQPSEQWTFQETGDGWLRLVSRLSGKYLSVVQGATTDGSALHQWPWLGNPDQQWRLAPVGTVKLVNRNSNKCVDVSSSGTADGTLIQQWTCNGTGAQQWTFTHTDNGYYRITNQNSGKVIDVGGGSTGDGAAIRIWTWAGVLHQQLRIVPLGDGFFRIVPRHSGKAVDVSGCGTGDGARIQQWTWLNNNCQRFAIKV